jgi:tetratricopeptide (TPR) repeat protein
MAAGPGDSLIAPEPGTVVSADSQEARGNLRTALDHAAHLLGREPLLAQEQAQEILKVFPATAGALEVLGSALRRQGKFSQALDILQPLQERMPESPRVHYELGLCYGPMGRGAEALTMLRRAVTLDPQHAAAWLALGDQLQLAGDSEGSLKALQCHLATASSHPDLAVAAEHLYAGELAKAEPLVRNILKRNPADVSAMRMLADIGMRLSQYQDARNLLERCLELAPDYHLARHNLTVLLLRRQELEAALQQVNTLLQHDSTNPNYLILKASVLVRRGEHREALAIYEKILANYPDQAQAQLNYGHTLKTVGRLDDAIAAYQRSIDLKPDMGEAYWSLANLKTYRFSDAQVSAMRAAVTSEGGNAEDQSHLGFALGKALEDRGEYDESFRFYKRGNAIRRIQQPFNADKNMLNTVRQIKTCTREFFAQREGAGCTAPDPIFIVGLPRAGSTLLEQILASHSQVDGTAELPDIIALSRKLGGRQRDKAATLYPEILADLSTGQRLELGQGYIDSTRIQRGSSPYFIDKMPNNFMHIGLIHLILPQARIIDARRHPMAGCFAGYKQLFAQGQTYTYDLTDVGYYYRNYVRLMDHWDEALPARVLRVQYEDMVTDAETQIRRLLDYCGLPFEEQCLRFYETDRAIRTPSSEQVRQPIFTHGLEQWRNYEQHLDGLKEALGPLLQRYPI